MEENHRRPTSMLFTTQPIPLGVECLLHVRRVKLANHLTVTLTRWISHSTDSFCWDMIWPKMQCDFSGKYFWFQHTTFIPSAGSFQYKAIKITVKHPINAHRCLQAWQDIFNFQQPFMEWKSDHFWLRYNQKREKRLNMGVCVEGEGRLLEGGVYWVFYGRPSAVHTHYLSSKRNWTLPPKTFRNSLGTVWNTRVATSLKN